MNEVIVHYNDEPVDVCEGESLLEAALRKNIALPHSCKNGICQTCLIKIDQGDIPNAAQSGLNENQKKQGFALACQLKPEVPLSILSVNHQIFETARIVGHEKLNTSVLRLRLSAQLSWFPGQYLTIWKSDSEGRPYSIASLNSENYLEFHIKKHELGAVSRWLHDDVSEGDEIRIGNPLGQCVYDSSMKDKSLLLAGNGTGLAPLYGVIRDALQQDHSKKIVLFIAHSSLQEIYLHEELINIAKNYPSFSYLPFIRSEEKNDSDNKELRQISAENIVEAVKKELPTLQQWCVFLCGSPSLVQKLQKNCFLSGASMSDIYTDPFITK